jgi:hypothetical protein
MKALKYLFAFSLMIGLTLAAPAAVLLDDDWDDADRTDTNLPEEAAWYGSTAFSVPTLGAEAGALRGNVLMLETNTSSRLWITHFTPSGSPTELAIGDTLKATLVFIPSNVTAGSSGRGFRIGLFNFSEPGASRVSADGFSTGAGGGAPGTNVTGYMLNMNFGQTLIGNPLQLMKRTDYTNINLMGALAAFTSLGSGGIATEGGFRSDVEYTFEFTLKRLQAGVEVTARFSDTNGWSLTHTATDANNPHVRFDGFALRPDGVVNTAHSFTFKQFKVEHVPYELRIRSLELIPPFNDALLTFEALRDKTYQVEWRANLSPTSGWNPLGGPITGNGELATVQDQDAGFESERYYRVVQLP